eukprot:TRINITY_DN7543_c0_g1_i1.p2 TRINITY_DN7543_c0_g1~~TRINITY_DN7543_c0_g1_i1.p2  ORF type:complete len:204 (-),score=68.13 TRINITY_DN7543_c0_g1_i1:17-628(-)
MCPVHHMHVSVFDIAKAHLEKTHPLQVVGGFLSPSHDNYVGQKLGSDSIESIHRVEMCRLALASHPFVACSSWEAEQPRFVDFPGVTIFHQRHLREQFPDANLEIMYLCGADHAVRCMLMNGMRGIPVVCVSRPGSERHMERLQTKDGVFYVVESGLDLARANASSTEVRKRMAMGAPIDGLVGPAVASYLHRNVPPRRPEKR